MSNMLFEDYWSELSSANNQRIDNILTATPFTDIKNKSSLNPDPWSIPADI